MKFEKVKRSEGYSGGKKRSRYYDLVTLLLENYNRKDTTAAVLLTFEPGDHFTSSAIQGHIFTRVRHLGLEELPRLRTRNIDKTHVELWLEFSGQVISTF